MFVGWLILWRSGWVSGMRRLSLELPLAALAAAWGLSTLFALEPTASLVNMKKLLLVPIAYGFAWLVESERILKTVVMLMLAVALMVSLYGIVGYAGGYGLEESYRVRATLSSTVTLAGVLLFVFAISLSLTLFTNALRERIFLLPVTILSFVCLILTFTRGAWLGASVALVVTLARVGGRKRLVFLVLIAVLIAAPLLSERVTERAASITDVHEMSIRGRVSMWLSATQMAKDNVLFGVGLMDLGKVYDEYRRSDSGFRSGHMHSSFFHILASTGVVGLLAFLWFLYSICALLVRNFALTSGRPGFLNGVCLGAIAGFCAFVVAGVFEWNFGDAEVVSMLYCVVGLTCACERIQSSGGEIA
ncbi:MAG: hypothetical protein AMJ46_05765 [Latescibacteria bacterium DG_63]|nr:MAG: hypothetical protein AMJ46_05765 [Latescibacteria bacterium DG_63]